jgi:Methyltransferase domain
LNPIDQFLGELQASLAAGQFNKLTLGKFRGELAEISHIYVRLVELQSGTKLQFTERWPTKDLTKNLSFGDSIDLVRTLLGQTCLAATLFAGQNRVQLLFNRRGKPRLIRQADEVRPTVSTHDLPKQRLLRDESFLRALGVIGADGRPNAQMGSKYRQIHHFIELLSPLLASFQRGSRVRVADLGAGKGYLTFALYQYLSEQGLHPEIHGFEQRSELVALTNQIAQSIGFTALAFEAKPIADVDLSSCDLAVALHACDTATDDALFRAIVAGCHGIVVSPCCHKEVRPQLQVPSGLEALVRYGAQTDRFAEMITDTLRALYLNAAGYLTRVQEFIPAEHTPRNLLIIGTHNPKLTNRVELFEQAEDFRRRFGIRHQRLGDHLRRWFKEAFAATDSIQHLT